MIRRFAERLLHTLARDDEDLVCSPAGLWQGLAVMAAGARAETADELRELLGVAGPVAAEAVRELAVRREPALAAAVWSRKPMREDFRARLPHVGFGGLDDAAAIDAWVHGATSGLVERLPLAPDPDTSFLLVSAFGVREAWATPFEDEDTEYRPFTDARGNRDRVPMMTRKVPAAGAWAVGGTRVVELGCVRPELSVRIVLGEPGETAARVLAAAWAPATERTPLGAGADGVRIDVPRLSLRACLSLTEALAELGLEWSTTELADFSRMSEEPVVLRAVLQEALIEVSEAGFEAASVTQLMDWLGSPALDSPGTLRISFDRPFGMVLLAGEELPLVTAWQAGIPGEAEAGPAHL
ncbi:serine protease [Streptomyces lunaelactis]|uniref:serpin family protein n=1 Tax=Streptomyces lunaelactis TaxID=1535768 RepID=UPI00158484A6|nr:serpin family protein [Streptomyces lunaelactis]NUK04485.1 serine protease [Streptomyces lunaelactis]NUK12175.1 serine protease [Streptomyces lunaelactis]NUK20613.1 serine protease [Streptomyces lunaelactis]NUK27349.1 serine protease [Streptomyces lunaelactis]NUK44287.1 serine protease [Streptomyces lunaelactis]